MYLAKHNKLILWIIAVLLSAEFINNEDISLLRYSYAESEGYTTNNLTEDEIANRSDVDHARLVVEHGVLSIRVPETLQDQSGIRVQSLSAKDYRPKTKAYAKVLDIAPLILLRNRYQEAKSNSEIAAANLMESKQNLDRLHQLHQNQAISTRRYQQARSQWKSNKAKMNSGQYTTENIYAETLQNWGSVLTDWALNQDSQTHFKTLLDHRNRLILVTLQAGTSLAADVSSITVGRNANRENAVSSHLVSSAPRVDGLSQGETYFFMAPVKNLRIGMQLLAWVPSSSQEIHGVEIPLSAIIWRTGKPWVYVKTDNDRFTRRIVENFIELDQSWFVSRDLNPGEQIVVSGGQMLLSEEYRWQIPDEDD